MLRPLREEPKADLLTVLYCDSIRKFYIVDSLADPADDFEIDMTSRISVVLSFSEGFCVLIQFMAWIHFSRLSAS